MSKYFIQLVLLTSCALLFSMPESRAKQTNSNKHLVSDLETIWPLVLIIKIEYDLVNAQLELLNSDKQKKEFLSEYEEFVKKKYFDLLKTLNLRQGKLLLLLIHRELGETPFELISKYLNLRRAIRWQRYARVVGADLRNEYHSSQYTEIESIVRHMERNPAKWIKIAEGLTANQN